MKTMMAVFTLVALHASATHGECCGNAAPVQAAIALHEECEALRKLVKPNPPAIYKAEFAAAIKATREKVIAYTKTHTGDDLDSLHWGNAISVVYLTSVSREWNSIRESEAALREIWNILSQLKPQDPQRPIDLCLDIARSHIQAWSRIDPETCAALMDEATLRFLPNASRGATSGWKFVTPFYEEQLIAGAANLPPERRAAFQQQRESALFLSIQDESQPLTTSSDQLAAYAGQLYGKGEAERATVLLDAWWAKHGDKIQSAQYYSTRFHTACYGTGDWEKARDMLRRMDTLVDAKIIPAEDGLYNLIVGNYYKNIPYYGCELKRRAAEFNKKNKETKNPTEKKMKLTTALTGLLICLGLVNAEDAAPFIHKVINISPSAPISAWPVELPQKATAKVTINVAKTGTVNNVNYKIKNGSEPDYSITPPGGAVIWKKTQGKKGDTTFEFKVVNSTTTSSVFTTANVECVWESEKSKTGSGGGIVNTAPDIKGLAMAMANLQIAGSCAWSFNRTTQLADGLGEIDYRVALLNAQGQIQTTPFTNVEAFNPAPAAATWTYSATAGASPLVGNVKSSTPSKGVSQASYTEPGTTAAKTCKSVTELVFWNLEHNVEQVAKKDQTLTRVKLGLSERVYFRLFPTSTVGNWSIITGNGFLKTRSGWATLFTAPPTAQDVVTRVEVDGIFKDLTFKIVAPADVVATGIVTYTRQVHTINEYDCDALIEVEFLPTDVSFYRVRVSEQAGTKTESDDWSIAPWHPAVAHQGYALKYIPADNTTTDRIHGAVAGMNQQTNWPNGSYTWHIPMDYYADAGSLVANWKSFDQVHTTTAVNDGECEIVITKFGPKGRASNY